MGTRRFALWRVFVYNNNLYSLPGGQAPSYRDWRPCVYRCHSDELQRVMSWVNRDIPVLIGTNKGDIVTVYDLILSLLPRISLKSYQFKAALASYLGVKTNQFIHELINFARSPYDDLISYELNVHYYCHYCDDADEEPSSSAAAQNRKMAIQGLHNFVEFARSVNDDECSGYDLELEFEDEDEGEDDALDALSAIEESQKFEVLPVYSVERRRPQAAAVSTGGRGYINGPDMGGFELELAIERSILGEADYSTSEPQSARTFLVPTGAAPSSVGRSARTMTVSGLNTATDSTVAAIVGPSSFRNQVADGRASEGRIKRRRMDLNAGNHP
ncbi:E3 ubiquitin-protein ligase Topors [Scaptodrosophila lebanonensis]|uniref:RING-type E3 ubiquitin transferase n=1 Tax=Drosophila lebanonensis TaxID=7225 RepID=A0A6J2T2P7_DROLE|nr:E3 ubiquitin-protein ligase Topors-like [Scaptodrosophila lebanonensis]XP_030388464.1 E3 ubiquitin-protein ligase Topors [Scaptodrosophila lebanonensis]